MPCNCPVVELLLPSQLKQEYNNFTYFLLSNSILLNDLLLMWKMETAVFCNKATTKGVHIIIY